MITKEISRLPDGLVIRRDIGCPTSLPIRRERHGRLLLNLGCFSVPLVACLGLLASLPPRAMPAKPAADASSANREHDTYSDVK